MHHEGPAAGYGLHQVLLDEDVDSAPHGADGQAGLRGQRRDRGQLGGDLATLDLATQPASKLAVGMLVSDLRDRCPVQRADLGRAIFSETQTEARSPFRGLLVLADGRLSQPFLPGRSPAAQVSRARRPIFGETNDRHGQRSWRSGTVP